MFNHSEAGAMNQNRCQTQQRHVWRPHEPNPVVSAQACSSADTVPFEAKPSQTSVMAAPVYFQDQNGVVYQPVYQQVYQPVSQHGVMYQFQGAGYSPCFPGNAANFDARGFTPAPSAVPSMCAQQLMTVDSNGYAYAQEPIPAAASAADESEVVSPQQVDISGYVPGASVADAKSSVSSVAGHVLKLSLENKPGSEKVQEALGQSRSMRKAILLELHGHVLQMVQNKHANRVIEKACKICLPADIDFIVEELKQAGILHIARHEFGYRIIQRLLELGSRETLTYLVNSLLPHCAALSEDPHGTWVVQTLLERGEREVVESVAIELRIALDKGSINLASEAGAVIETLLEDQSRLKQFDRLAVTTLADHVLCSTVDFQNGDASKLEAMACCRKGHKAVLLALKNASVPLRKQAWAALEPSLRLAEATNPAEKDDCEDERKNNTKKKRREESDFKRYARVVLNGFPKQMAERWATILLAAKKMDDRSAAAQIRM